MKQLLQLSAVTKSFGAVRALRAFRLICGPAKSTPCSAKMARANPRSSKSSPARIRRTAARLKSRVSASEKLSPAAAHKLGIACIYQQPALFPDLTVAENIGLRLERASSLSRVDWKERRRRAAELLRRIGAEISPDAEIRSLSMPEQQLVEIACALGAGARIVIMDEPTASLTQKEVELLFAVVRDLRSSGVGVIYISHRLEEIFQLADRVTVLRDGESVGTYFVSSSRCNEAQTSNHASG